MKTTVKAWMNHHYSYNEKEKLDTIYYAIRDGHITCKETIDNDQEIEITIKEIE